MLACSSSYYLEGNIYRTVLQVWLACIKIRNVELSSFENNAVECLKHAMFVRPCYIFSSFNQQQLLYALRPYNERLNSRLWATCKKLRHSFLDLVLLLSHAVICLLQFSQHIVYHKSAQPCHCFLLLSTLKGYHFHGLLVFVLFCFSL